MPRWPGGGPDACCSTWRPGDVAASTGGRVAGAARPASSGKGERLPSTACARASLLPSRRPTARSGCSVIDAGLPRRTWSPSAVWEPSSTHAPRRAMTRCPLPAWPNHAPIRALVGTRRRARDAACDAWRSRPVDSASCVADAEGPRGIGKATLAYRFRADGCSRAIPTPVSASSVCRHVARPIPSSASVAGGAHPRPADDAGAQGRVNAKTKKLRDRDRRRRRARGCDQAHGHRTARGGRRVRRSSIAADEFLNRNAANAMLKVRRGAAGGRRSSSWRLPPAGRRAGDDPQSRCLTAAPPRPAGFARHDALLALAAGTDIRRAGRGGAARGAGRMAAPVGWALDLAGAGALAAYPQLIAAVAGPGR